MLKATNFISPTERTFVPRSKVAGGTAGATDRWSSLCLSRERERKNQSWDLTNCDHVPNQRLRGEGSAFSSSDGRRSAYRARRGRRRRSCAAADRSSRVSRASPAHGESRSPTALSEGFSPAMDDPPIDDGRSRGREGRVNTSR